MNHKLKPRLLLGNWKMHYGPQTARAFAEQLKTCFLSCAKKELGIDRIFVYPPTISLTHVATVLEHTDIEWGAQQIDWHHQGAYTGETSPLFIQEIQATSVLIGHSERRQLFYESLQDTQKKLAAATALGLLSVLCVGETYEQRQQRQTFSIVQQQLEEALVNFDTRNISCLVIAYEPVWAIGTGLVASCEQAEEVHAFIDSYLQSRFFELASMIPIVYGGSVKHDNAANLLCQPHVDGVLVGGACLDAAHFFKIAQCFKR